jgi:hypothetical protein
MVEGSGSQPGQKRTSAPKKKRSSDGDEVQPHRPLARRRRSAGGSSLNGPVAGGEAGRAHGDGVVYPCSRRHATHCARSNPMRSLASQTKRARKAARYAEEEDMDEDVTPSQPVEPLETPSGALKSIRLENFMCRACPAATSTCQPTHASSCTVSTAFSPRTPPTTSFEAGEGSSTPQPTTHPVTRRHTFQHSTHPYVAALLPSIAQLASNPRSRDTSFG